MSVELMVRRRRVEELIGGLDLMIKVEVVVVYGRVKIPRGA